MIDWWDDGVIIYYYFHTFQTIVIDLCKYLNDVFDFYSKSQYEMIAGYLPFLNQDTRTKYGNLILMYDQSL